MIEAAAVSLDATGPVHSARPVIGHSDLFRSKRLQSQRGVDAFTLKIVAIVAMTIDHVGALLYPEALWLRVIGRLTMPIIAFLLVEGYHHTRSVPRYALRLLAFAVIAQFAYRLAFPVGINVFFDLLAGLGVIWAADRLRSAWLQGLLLIGVCGLAIVVSLDWWHLGVLMIFIFHRTRGHFARSAIALGALLVANAMVFAVIAARTGNDGYATINTIHLGCLLALPLLRLYDGRRGADLRYFFYAYYPAHLVALWGIKTIWF
ncbi:MAG: TraX family protein [Burkholderiaceae bacterium]